MDLAEGLNPQSNSEILAQEVLQCESKEDLLEWIIEHSEAIDDAFFDTLTTWHQRAADKGLTEQSEWIQIVIRYIRFVLASFQEVTSQKELFHRLLKTSSRDKTLQELREILPEITATFFRFLKAWADQSTPNSDAAIEICEELLYLIGGNNLRDDWSAQERIIIHGAVQILGRMLGQNWTPAINSLLETYDEDVRFSYEALADVVILAYNLAFDAGMTMLGLALLNVILEASPKAVGEKNGISATDELRSTVLGFGVKILLLGGKERNLSAARRLVEEVQIINARLVAERTDLEGIFRLSSNAAAMLDTLGDLAIDEENNPQKALQLYQQALQQREPLISKAKAEGASEDFIRKIGRGIPNTLRRIASAETKLWQLDNAYVHLEQAIAEYRKLGIEPVQLALHLESLAKIEFLRTNFPHAEVLLDEAIGLRQGGNNNG